MIKYIWILLAPVYAKPCPVNTFYLIGTFRPQCNTDGTWMPKQCWASTGTCWCVDKHGEKLTEPSIGPLDCTTVAIGGRNYDMYKIKS